MSHGRTGNVKKSFSVARVLKKNKPKTTYNLRDLIKNSNDVAPIFQALRIAVNDEMGQIKKALESVNKLLQSGGKCVCVTFHSIEDRIVKNTFRKWCENIGDPHLPTIDKPQYRLLKTAVPSDNELENNQRARSAHMRAVVKI